MRTSHKLLLRLWYDPEFDFSRVRITYVNRGAPHDLSDASGEAIAKLDSQYIEIYSGGYEGVTCIPYHRIRKIEYDNVVMWEYGVLNI